MIFQLPGERGYHVYYQILSGKKPELQGEGQGWVGWESELTGLGASRAAWPLPGPCQTKMSVPSRSGICDIPFSSEPLLFLPSFPETSGY